MKKLFKWYTIIGIFLLIIVIIPIGTYWYISSYILTPQKLKSMLKTEISQTIKGDFDCKSIQLSYWETWPTVSFTIDYGSFHGEQPRLDNSTNPLSDLTIYFEKLYVYINVMDYFINKKLDIDKIVVKKPSIDIQTTNHSNPFDLLKEESAQNPSLQSFNLCIEEGNLEWEDLGLYESSTLENIGINITGTLNSMIVSLNSDKVTLDLFQQGTIWDFPLNLTTHLALNPELNQIIIKSATANVNDISYTSTGEIRLDQFEKLWIDANVNLEATELSDLFKNYTSSSLNEYQITGHTSLKGTIKGYIGDNIYPNLTINGQISDGSIIRKKQQNGLEKINMDFLFDYPSTRPDSSTLEIKNIHVSGLNSSLGAQINIKKLFTAPFIDMQLKSDINLDRLGNEFFDPQTVRMKGDLKSDLSLVFNLNDLKEGHYDRIWADGFLTINQLSVHSDKYQFSAFASNTQGNIGYKENKSHFIRQREVLGINLHADTLHFNMQPEIQIAVADLNVKSNTGLQQDTTIMTPITGHIKVKKMQAKLYEDIALLLTNANLHMGIKPSERHQQEVDVATAFDSDSLEYLDIVNKHATKLIRTQFATETSYTNTKQKLDLLSFDRNFDMSAIKGYLLFDYLHSYTKRFPLHIKIHDTQLGFKNNHLILNKSHLQVGESDASINGKLESLSDSYKISGHLNVKSNNLNLNELRNAYLYLLSYNRPFKIENNETDKLLNIQNLDKALDLLDNKNDTIEIKEQLFDIPERCSLGIDLNTNQVTFRDMNMDNMNCKIQLIDKKAMVDFSTSSNLGGIHGNFSYKYKNEDQADIFIDCKMDQIQVGKLKATIPEINTLFPLISDMDGVLDAKIVGIFPLNKEMDVELSKLYVTCSLEGNNMILMNKKLYHQIAQKFRFKDKERNIIEHIAVDCIAEDNKIEVFPFLLDMDRCSFIIGGEHNMNMNYVYHIDVLKSFIPIDFGVNIQGNLDDFDIKLRKIKYKSLFSNPINHQEFNMEKKRKINETQAKILKLAGNL